MIVLLTDVKLSIIVVHYLKCKTNASIYQIKITIENIVDIINKKNSNKAGGYDGISVYMLQLCVSEVAFPLQIIIQKSIETGKFLDTWKYANVQPIHENGNCQTKSNYQPISLLPLFGKKLEKIVFDQVYSYTHNLLSKRQSGFRPGNSTIFQLISIISTICRVF